ncbi:hypothetical protein ASH02_19885 [Nocardioides sp. Soil796]|nr:hypothetical protein ASH02_19885 [Nocardioides sp. Soil796]
MKNPALTDCPPSRKTPRPELLPGLLITAGGVAVAMGLYRLMPEISALTWSVLLGAILANVGRIPDRAKPGLKIATKKVLRLGVVLLGFSLPAAAILGLGLPIIVLTAATLVTTLVATTWLGQKMGMGRPRSLLIGTGFAICGASAIAAMEQNAEADEEDVTTALAMVTMCGTAVMLLIPLLAKPLGLSEVQFGAWAGASVHDVGQVVGAASAIGGAAVGVAVVVKLTRVLMLAPVVATVSVMRRRQLKREGVETEQALPPIVPLFVIGFLVCVAFRTTGLIPEGWLPGITLVQTIALSAALFGMGTAVNFRQLVRHAGPALLLGVIATVLIGALSLCGVLFLL